MPSIYSVYQVNSYIKNMFAQDCMLGLVCVRGEISNLKYHTTGHIYFTLKDDKSTINCVMFAGNKANGLKFRMEEGQQVVVKGSIQVYERDGKYQLYAKEITREGDGDLYLRYLALKEKLEEMGMFDEMFKRPIPRYIKKLGVVTAQTGAAIRDIINIASRRNPYVQIVLCPALVQGPGAPESIVRAIRQLETTDVDTIIVGRGGGSMEDLFCFNDEAVAQAIFDCPKPVISAVGHEVDFTIADFVADHRAPTPSAAAEIAVFDIGDFVSDITVRENRLNDAMGYILSRTRDLLIKDKALLTAKSPDNKLKDSKHRVETIKNTLQALMDGKLQERKQQVLLSAERLKGLSPLEKLTLGYARAEGKGGETVSSISQVSGGDELRIYVSDGYIDTIVKETGNMDIR